MITSTWAMPVSWSNLSNQELEHAVRNGWAGNVGDVVEQIYTVGTMAAYYAWGRLDQGADNPLPTVDENGHHLGRSEAVRAFKILFEKSKRDMFTGATVSMPSVQDAWETFVATGGTAVGS